MTIVHYIFEFRDGALYSGICSNNCIFSCSINIGNTFVSVLPTVEGQSMLKETFKFLSSYTNLE